MYIIERSYLIFYDLIYTCINKLTIIKKTVNSNYIGYFLYMNTPSVKFIMSFCFIKIIVFFPIQSPTPAITNCNRTTQNNIPSPTTIIHFSFSPKPTNSSSTPTLPNQFPQASNHQSFTYPPTHSNSNPRLLKPPISLPLSIILTHTISLYTIMVKKRARGYTIYCP